MTKKNTIIHALMVYFSKYKMKWNVSLKNPKLVGLQRLGIVFAQNFIQRFQLGFSQIN